MQNHLSKDEIDQRIIQIVRQKKPENIEQLIKLTQDEFHLSQQEIFERILYLKETEKLNLKSPQTIESQKLTEYLSSKQAYWYWIAIVLTLTAALVVFIIPQDAFPLVTARYILGSIVVLWLPGYTLVKALFPGKGLDFLERFALSMLMSLALVPIVALLLNYSPWGIESTSIIVSLFPLTLVLATVAVIREHKMKAVKT